MSEPVFADKTRLPSDADLATVLGAANAHWDFLIAFVRKNCPEAVHEWKFYGAKYGWQLKIVHAKKALLYMIPHQGGFNAALALRPPALAALREAGLPEEFVREIEAAKESPEGRPARVFVKTKKDAALAAKLVGLKLTT
ncbi:MAG: DUF3788 family protein [Deltaproteobacteria bacterium]|nr:DUF3788 family protein [Deltaproteobacteria bacterium]